MPDVEIKSLKEYPEYKDRVEYIEDRQRKTAVLRLHNITENDERMYCFRLITEIKRKNGLVKKEFILMFLVIHFCPLFLLYI